MPIFIFVFCVICDLAFASNLKRIEFDFVTEKLSVRLETPQVLATKKATYEITYDNEKAVLKFKTGKKIYPGSLSSGSVEVEYLKDKLDKGYIVEDFGKLAGGMDCPEFTRSSGANNLLAVTGCHLEIKNLNGSQMYLYLRRGAQSDMDSVYYLLSNKKGIIKISSPPLFDWEEIEIDFK